MLIVGRCSGFLWPLLQRKSSRSSASPVMISKITKKLLLLHLLLSREKGKLAARLAIVPNPLEAHLFLPRAEKAQGIALHEGNRRRHNPSSASLSVAWLSWGYLGELLHFCGHVHPVATHHRRLPVWHRRLNTASPRMPKMQPPSCRSTALTAIRGLMQKLASLSTNTPTPLQS